MILIKIEIIIIEIIIKEKDDIYKIIIKDKIMIEIIEVKTTIIINKIIIDKTIKNDKKETIEKRGLEKLEIEIEEMEIIEMIEIISITQMVDIKMIEIIGIIIIITEGSMMMNLDQLSMKKLIGKKKKDKITRINKKKEHGKKIKIFMNNIILRNKLKKENKKTKFLKESFWEMSFPYKQEMLNVLFFLKKCKLIVIIFI